MCEKTQQMGCVLLKCLSDPNLDVVCEALNTLYDVFGDDKPHTYAVVKKLNLVHQLRGFVPIFAKRV